MNPYALEIYTDGSSKIHHNCDAGCAFIVVYPEHVKIDKPEEHGKSYIKSKIGAMEIQGVNQALKWLVEHINKLKSLNINTAIIYCDNEYVVNCANKHVFNWQRNKWKKRNGGDIANISAWKEYSRYRRSVSLRVDIKHIIGKTSAETKKVDKLAKKYADSISKYKSEDFMLFKASDKLIPSELSKEICPTISGVMIRIYYHQPVNKTKNSEFKVYFEIIKNEVVTGSYVAFCTKEFNKKYIDRKNYHISNIEQRDKGYAVFLNAEKITGRELKNIKKLMRKKYSKC